MNTCWIPSALVVILATLASTHAKTVRPAWAIFPNGTSISEPPPFPQTTASWMTTGNNVRGVAANPVTGNVLIADINQNIRVHDSDGNELHTLDRSGLVSGGLLSMVHVKVADDGVVYAANISGGAAVAPVTFRIWRWENDSNPNPDPLPDGFEPVVATLAWEGDPAAGANNQRWGDSFDVKGAGVNTKTVTGSRNPSALCVLDTQDGINFTPHVVPYPGGDHLGVAFGPDIPGYDDPGTPAVEAITLLTVFAKATASTLFRVSIRPDTWAVVATTPYNGGTNPPPLPAGITTLATDSNATMLGTVMAAPGGSAYLFEIANPAAPTLISQRPFYTTNANPNGIAAADVFVARPDQTPGENGIPEFNRFYALQVNNGVIAFDIVPAQLPPEITTGPPSGQPANTTVLSGWKATFSVTATGTTPLNYQWFRDDAPIANATGSTYILDPVVESDSGTVFTVRVSNVAGNVTSETATLSVLPRPDTPVMTPAWRIPVGQRPYIDTNNTQRGLTYNPANNHLLLVNRSSVASLPPPPHIIVLDAATGAEIPNGDIPRLLRLTDESENPLVTGGTFPLNMIDCDDAGVVYAANLAEGNTVGAFTVYRWENDDPATVPKIAFGAGDVFASDRCGDQFKVRGSGVSTQFLVGARNQPKFALFTTVDGLNFEAFAYEVPDAGATAFFQCDFGAGNTVWAKTSGGRLLHVSFNPTTRETAIEQIFTGAQFPAGVGPIGIHPARNLLGAVHIGENPNNLRLYDTTLIGQPGGLLDLEFFPTDNTNSNGTGAVDFGGNRIFALDTNNGLLAINITYSPSTPAPSVLGAVEYIDNVGSEVLRFQLSGESGRSYRIDGSPTMATGSWTAVRTVTLAGTSQLVEINIPEGQTSYHYRAVTLP
ncbi:MAG: hypothetical protein ACKV19_12105 [Verrucomicrobiales bacterium]